MASEMSYGKNVGKFKPKVPTLQSAGQGEKNRKKEKFSFSILKDLELLKKKRRPGKAFNA
jgi:hypothetical protein